MERAAILIGVSKTGGLRRLRAVETGISKMTAWATSQRITGDRLVTITDAAKPVEVATIRQAVKQFVDRATIGQLIIYFAGHGVNIRRGEYWLLSDAPDDSNAAVNLDGSVVLARSCTIPHVVCISDACRTAAEGIQAQSITGGEIFPNVSSGGPEQPTDLFFASALGAPALEIRDVDESTTGYTALYTDVLSEALFGNVPPVVDWKTSGGYTSGYVRPRPLKRYLRTAVTATATRNGRTMTVSQTPDARITSDEDAWIAEVSPPAGLARSEASPLPRLSPPSDEAPSLFSVSHDMLQTAIGAALAGGPPPDVGPADALGNEGHALASTITRNTQMFGPVHFETRCGFKVRGQTVVSAVTHEGSPEILGDSLIRLNQPSRPVNVVIVFGNGTATVLPAIPEFITELSFDGDDLESVVYEPADTSPRWLDVQPRAADLRRLRAVIAGASRLGTFRLTDEDAPALARAMQLAKGLDPAMALYAAYAYHDLGLGDRLREMNQYQRKELGITFFDVALLARAIDGTGPRDGARQGVLPPFPALSQGWALLNACRITLPPPLDGLHRWVLPSLWTLCEPIAVPRLIAAVRMAQ
jgi:hypothetical protein